MTNAIRDGTSLRASRQRTMERTIARLGERLGRLNALERRFAWYRLIVFALGVGATWLAVVELSTRATWIVMLASIAAFAAVVGLHRRLDAWITRYTIWRKLRLTQLARMTLDWEHIPSSIALPGTRSSLDIDLDLTGERSLHHLVDLAVSNEGGWLLANWLTNPLPDPEKIEERQAIVRELVDLPRFRDRLLLNFHLVSEDQLRGDKLLAWLTLDYPARQFVALFIGAAVFVVLNATLFWLHNLGRIPAYWPFTLGLYAIFYLAAAGMTNPFLNTIVDLDRELDKFRTILRHLESFPLDRYPKLESLCAPFRDPDQLPSAELQRIKWVTAAVGLRMNPLMRLILNLVLPWDFAIALLAGKLRQRAAVYLPEWLDIWYRLEAMVSLANFAYLNPEYCFPEIRELSQPAFLAEGLGHPLIPVDSRVCNDFRLAELGQVILITGSNMAGKSTFIKTVGVNLCLAYAGGAVGARAMRTLPFRLHTCIRITDSVIDGFSYFYAEVKCLKRLMDALQDGAPLSTLYLIDEIFRGTNNRERLIGSKAYIRRLTGADGAGLIATHDLELANLAQESLQVVNYHFTDRVENQRLVFDYEIRPGPSPTTNALKIMEMEGLPVAEDN